MSRPAKPVFANPEAIQRKKIAGDLRAIADQVAHAVVRALVEEIDELSAQTHEVRAVMESTAFRVMQHIDRSSERVGIYEEALPGFTLMIIKKQDGPITSDSKINDIEPSLAEETFEAASLMIAQFMTRAKQNILSIEHDAVLLILFPVADTRKHLKALGMPLT